MFNVHHFLFYLINITDLGYIVSKLVLRGFGEDGYPRSTVVLLMNHDHALVIVLSSKGKHAPVFILSMIVLYSSMTVLPLNFFSILELNRDVFFYRTCRGDIIS